jgi:Protein of unknown function (DUF1353)
MATTGPDPSSGGSGLAAKFLSHLRVEEVSDTAESGRGLWRLLEEFAYESDVPGVGRVVVPAGFVTDFASVPRIPVAFWLVGGTAHAAAVVHDWLYTTGQVPKRSADLVLYEAMVLSGLSSWRCWTIYEGVNWGGDKAWNDHRAQDHKPAHLRVTRRTK